MNDYLCFWHFEYDLDILSTSQPRDFKISVEVLINGKKATSKNIPYSETA
jgi:hypothetical protein